MWCQGHRGSRRSPAGMEQASVGHTCPIQLLNIAQHHVRVFISGHAHDVGAGYNTGDEAELGLQKKLQ